MSYVITVYGVRGSGIVSIWVMSEVRVVFVFILISVNVFMVKVVFRTVIVISIRISRIVIVAASF
jgi:hypothetical protein